MSVKSKMTAIADNIRAKTGGTEALNLDQIAEGVNEVYDAGYAKGVAEGGTAEPETPTDNRTSMAYWYQYLADRYISIEWNEEYEYDEIVINPIPSLEFPTGTQNVTNFAGMFLVRYWDDMQYLREDNLIVDEFIGTLDVTNANFLEYLFQGHSKATSIKVKGGAKCANFRGMFSGCASLIDYGELTTSNGQDFGSMFYNCKALEVIGDINCSQIHSNTAISSMFSGCTSLKRVGLKNVRVNVILSASPNLEQDCLINIIGELINVTNSRTLTIGSTNLAKLKSVYVKTIPITDEMREADANIDKKLPFEVCKSTDEGATLITTYVSAKNWALK